MSKGPTTVSGKASSPSAALGARGAAAAACVAALALQALVACTSSAPAQTNLMRETGGVAVTATELRIRIRTFASNFALLVEDGADRIIEETDDRSVRFAALQW